MKRKLKQALNGVLAGIGGYGAAFMIAPFEVQTFMATHLGLMFLIVLGFCIFGIVLCIAFEVD